jgi:hypothetical protein
MGFPSGHSAANNMPFDVIVPSFFGARLVQTTTALPISASGLYYSAAPTTTSLNSDPMSTTVFRIFCLLGICSAKTILPTQRFTFDISSIVIILFS